MRIIVQTNFIKFHENIKLNDLEDNKPLREKRDMLLDEIRAYLKKLSEETLTPLITFDSFNQGSYSMGTGNKALHEDEDHDIDVGLAFNLAKESIAPVELKKHVFNALSAKNRSVTIKKSCVRVQYIESGLPKFHIDFAVYSDGKSNINNKTYIAKGKPESPQNEKLWQESEPKKLKDLVNNRFDEDDQKMQFKRTIRYMKRWKDFKFSNTKDGRPTGIALTSLAYKGFTPYTKESFTGNLQVDDLKAVTEFVKFILGEFDLFTDKISTKLPVPPHNNLFEKMTDVQMKNFKKKLEDLKSALLDADAEPDTHEACKILKGQFGDDFPVPPKEETGQSRRKAVAGTSESA